MLHCHRKTGNRPQILDQMGEVFSQSKAPYESAAKAIPSLQREHSQATLRKPLLYELRQSRIDSFAQLEPFFSRVSLATYEKLYVGGGIDWESVEIGIRGDLFEL